MNKILSVAYHLLEMDKGYEILDVTEHLIIQSVRGWLGEFEEKSGIINFSKGENWTMV